MEQKKLSELSDEELMREAGRMKSATIMNAVFIGFLGGIIFYSVMANSLGFLTLIPLFLAYKLIKKSKYDRDELESILKERKLS